VEGVWNVEACIFRLLQILKRAVVGESKSFSSEIFIPTIKVIEVIYERSKSSPIDRVQSAKNLWDLQSL
jgi:hypothetical protein